MTRPRNRTGTRSVRPGLSLGLSLVVTLLVVTVLPLLGTAPAVAAEADPATALSVRLVRLTPAAIPAKGRIVLAGTVRNDSEELWSLVNVHPFLSRTPMRTRDELTAAAKTDADAYVGTRLTGAGQFAALGDLKPGQTLPFRISLPVKDLLASVISGDSGVYWIGVHALGQRPSGAREIGGRARTFIPLVRGSRTTSVALVVPVREQVRRDPDGRVLGTTGWSDDLTASGRLGRLGGFLATASGHPATLLVDPAVLDAVADLKAGNPPLSLGTGEPTDPGSTPSPTDGLSRSFNRLDPVDRANAGTWLDEVIGAARSHTTLGLGYGDPDVSALARLRPTMFSLAGKLAVQTFDGLDISAVPTVAPPEGWLDDDALAGIPEESMVLVSDHDAPRNRTQWRSSNHQDLVFTDAATSSGGPTTADPFDALALRQRIVSDAALRLRDSSAGPLVVELPSDWDPGVGWQLADFFNALDTGWLDLVGLTGSTDAVTPSFDAALGYPAAQRKEEIDRANVTTGRSLIVTTTVLSRLLRTKNDVAHHLAGVAFGAVSYHARADQALARADVAATNNRMRSTLGKVEVLGTNFVTLSGGSGTLAVTLVNGLDQPITVGIASSASQSGVTIEKVPPLEMAPGQRTVLRLKAEATKIGVNQVVLTPVTIGGNALGTPLTFSLRTSQVGKLIWFILLAGGLLLVVMIARRIRTALREHRWRRA